MNRIDRHGVGQGAPHAGGMTGGGVTAGLTRRCEEEAMLPPPHPASESEIRTIRASIGSVRFVLISFRSPKRIQMLKSRVHDRCDQQSLRSLRGLPFRLGTVVTRVR